MKPAAHPCIETHSAPVSWAACPSAGNAPHLNAVKHGLCSARVVLPGEDVAEFQRQRHDLFASYQPRTEEEARTVEDMISCEWRKARCQRWAGAVDDQVDALWSGDPRVGSHCDGDPHRWVHNSNDCEVKEGRLERLLTRAHARLIVLQQQRRNNLIAGAMDVMRPWQELERAGARRLGLLQDAAPPEAAQADKAVDTPASAASSNAAPVEPHRTVPAIRQEDEPKASSHGEKTNDAERIPTGWPRTGRLREARPIQRPGG
jgi:hypothetical protein